MKRYEDAFRCFEKASNVLKHSPKVGLISYNLNFLIVMVLYGTKLLPYELREAPRTS